ncbi:hypothetical protein A3F52_03540 [Candidatus Uhrbacteria bacterium RIFCSPHIGHO2_12_FULL_47_11]|nr:MAG: hypothetical protein A3F52_03540 [Candidatus Uhrbacteria bacterium RIFCSPHIGHO2_12_FULL_47_11]
MKKSAGFTLIELLVVMAIIGILAAVLFVAIGTSPQRESRDARRVADIDRIRLALTLHQREKGEYPTTLQGLVDSKIISNVPLDSQGTAYLYATNNDQSAFHVGAEIENPAPIANLGNDSDFNSQAAGWTNGFDGRDLSGGGAKNVYDVTM